MRSQCRRVRAISRDGRAPRQHVLLRIFLARVSYRRSAIRIVLATATFLASHAVLDGWRAAAGQDVAASDASVETQRAQNRALQSADLTIDDLPIDEAGRSAKTGRAIPGIRPRRSIPPEVQEALDGLRTRATRAAESLPSDSESVVITDLPSDPARRPRIDSAGVESTSQPAVVPVERNR